MNFPIRLTISRGISFEIPAGDHTIRRWMTSDNPWFLRVSIDFQQKFKKQTNTALLAEAIEKNLGSRDFSINKAIGWSLREYAKQTARRLHP